MHAWTKAASKLENAASQLGRSMESANRQHKYDSQQRGLYNDFLFAQIYI